MTINAFEWVEYCWAGLGLVWLVGLAFTKPVVRRIPTGPRAFQIALGALGVALMSIPSLDTGWMAISFLPQGDGGNGLAQFVGVALTLAGCLFACWARVVLGGNWSGDITVKDNHELIVKGPYALTRHPIYTGLLTAVVGTTFVVGKWRAIVGLIIVVLMLILKMSQEERLMTQQFPEKYPSYRQRVKALIPGLL
jgi:protein-S-isoprenylcysteine O-methyltransferase Ste14